MGERVAFEDLTTELANVRAKVERWAYNKMSSADEMKSAYQRHVVEHKCGYTLTSIYDNAGMLF
jgi:hypothetical protein